MTDIVNAALKFFGNRAAVWSLVVGLIVGLVIGWGPVSFIQPSFDWTDAAPVDLSTKFGYQQLYLALLAEHYAANPNADLASFMAERWASSTAAKTVENMATSLPKLQAQEQTVLPAWARISGEPELRALAGALNNLRLPASTAGGGTGTVCLFSLVLLAVLVVGVVFVLPRLRGRSEGGLAIQPPKVKVAVPSTGASGKVVEPEIWTGVSEKPISQFITTYEIGDNRYDMSFSIESGPDFLGECGVAISETIGVGAPDKVTALEVWLFDKNDIRTVTKVLMSEYCYNDSTLRSKLAPKGEAALIKPDGSVELDTQTLKLRARIVEMEYGSGGLPPKSFFDKVTLELAAWPTA